MALKFNEDETNQSAAYDSSRTVAAPTPVVQEASLERARTRTSAASVEPLAFEFDRETQHAMDIIDSKMEKSQSVEETAKYLAMRAEIRKQGLTTAAELATMQMSRVSKMRQERREDIKAVLNGVSQCILGGAVAYCFWTHQTWPGLMLGGGVLSLVSIEAGKLFFAHLGRGKKG